MKGFVAETVCALGFSALAVSASAEQQPPVFQAATELVRIPLVVTTARGEPVMDLKAADLELFENGKKRPIELLLRANVDSGDPALEVDLALLLDTSTSMREELESVRDAAAVFLEELPRGKVRGLVTFDGVVNRRRVSGDPRELLSGMLASAPGGLTLLFDALDDAISALRLSRARKVVVIWTDGEDRGSARSFYEVYRTLKESEVVVYVISYANHLGRLRPYGERYTARAKAQLGSFVSVSGGLLVDASEGGGREAFRKIASDLGSQYLLGFAPGAASHDEQRSLRIRARKDGVKLRYRESYRASSR